MKDSNKYIEFLKSGISINSQLGCNIGCKYCIVGEFQRNVEKEASPQAIVSQLKSHRFYHENIPLIINNRSEPLFPELKPDTVEFLRLLKENGFNNPKILISKLPFGSDNMDVLNNNNVFIFRTISGLPAHVEPTSTKSNIHKILIENSHIKENTDAKIIHYWRPVIRRLNSSEETIKDMLTNVCPHFDASVVSGIRVTHHIKTLMEQFGGDLSDWNEDTNHKFLPPDIWNNILTCREKINPDYLLFRHTSCTISYFTNKPDYNLHYCKAKNLKNCQTCPLYNKCTSFEKNINENELNQYFKQLGKIFTYEISAKNTLKINTPIYQDELSFLKMATQYKIEASDIQKSGSERALSNV